MSSSPQDGGQGSSTHQRPRIYGTRLGAANQDGTDFEIKMCALVFLRAVQSYSSFTMTSNDPCAGGFDDLVFSYGSPGNEQNILVQLKTSIKPINLSRPVKKSLKYYFQSLEKSNTSEYLKNCTYVFFTNADVKLNPSAANVDSPAKKLLCTTWKPDNVFQVNLNDDICKDFKNQTGAEDFVNRLLICRSQSGLVYLDELIKQELFKMCNGFVPEYRIIQQTFVEKIKAWWGEPCKAALDENWEEWTKLKEQLFDQNTLLKQITFCEDTLSDLENRLLDNKSDIILLKSESTEAQIACSKVYQSFIRKQCLRVLFTDVSEPHQSQDVLFSLWLANECEVLVITDVTNCCQKLRDNITNYKGNTEKQNKKKIVIVSSSDASTLGLSRDSVDVSPAEYIKSTFSQLDINSQHSLHNLAVNFQGKEIILGEIMDGKILEGGILQYVLTSPKIQSGAALPPRNGKYIPRTLSKKLLVNEGVLKSDDVFYICGTDQRDLERTIAKAKGVKLIYGNVRQDGFHAMTRKEMYEAISGFKCCAEILPEGPVHFLEIIDGSFYWIHSHGSTDDLFKYIEWSPREEEDCKKLRDAKCSLPKEEDLVRKEFQTVIVADEPGSGKTALLLEVANKMKDLYPNRWIIYIDLNKHSVTLDDMKQAGNVTRENVLDLLSKAANLDDSELGKQLLKYSVFESGDICILFDAFDEIAPSYTDTVLAILKFIFNEFKLSTLWIASRYNMKETLQKELESHVFRIERLSDEEQIDFMWELWGIEKAKEFHKKNIEKLPFGVRSLPLHLKMMSEISSDLDMSDNFLRISTPSDVVKLYEQFIEKRFDLFIKEKCSLNCASAVIETIKKNERERFMESHMLCSLYVLGLHHYADVPLYNSIMHVVRNLRKNIEEGNERLGIISGVVGHEPQFIHRTFAEYFAAKWLVKHWKENRYVLDGVSSHYHLQFVNKIFCLELDAELPAHLAVLNEDMDALKELKEEDLNKTDDIGRTPLHLAAMMTGRNALNVVSELLKYAPDLDIRDKLGHTPLVYAWVMCNTDVKIILRERGATWEF